MEPDTARDSMCSGWKKIHVGQMSDRKVNFAQILGDWQINIYLGQMEEKLYLNI